MERIHILCKTIECAKWNSCGSNYASRGKTLVEEKNNDKTFLCKNFKPGGKKDA